MPIIPRPPCRIDPLSFPVFGLSWYGSPHVEDGTSIVAYCGGGGSSKTGVHNKIIIHIHDIEFIPNDNDPEGSRKGNEISISTGDDVCVAIKVYENPMTKDVFILGAVGKDIHLYKILMNENYNPDAEEQEGNRKYDCPLLHKIMNAGDASGVNAVAVNVMANRLLIGCESGCVALYDITYNDDGVINFVDKWIAEISKDNPESQSTHVKAVCAVSFPIRSNTVVSSGKDGTAKVWNVNEGRLLQTLVCDITNPKAKGPPPKRKPQILVRGCTYGDMEGRVIYTVASARRGEAYLAEWILQDPQQGFVCTNRIECSKVPISAMSLSNDSNLLALGGVDGTITLMDMSPESKKFKVLKSFPEVHDLPVTCIAARPFFGLPLRTDMLDGGVTMHAISASADSQLANLTLQRKVPRKSKGSGGGGISGNGPILGLLFLLFGNPLSKIWYGAWLYLIFLSGRYIVNDINYKCHNAVDTLLEKKFDFTYDYNEPLSECIIHEVFIAKSSRPGILVPPH